MEINIIATINRVLDSFNKPFKSRGKEKEEGKKEKGSQIEAQEGE